MRLLKKCVFLLTVIIMLMALIGCKTTKETESQTAQPIQTAQAATGENPLTAFLVEQSDEKDMLIGEMGLLLDSYQPKANETDYTGLAQTALMPFSKADALLADVLVLAFYLQAQPDGNYGYDAQGQEASLSKQGQDYTYSGKVLDGSDEQSYQRQSAEFFADGSRMRVEIFGKQKEADEICTLSMQWVRENGGIYAQCYYTANGGESYDILRYNIENGTLTFAVYEAVESKTDLYSLPKEDLFSQGYVTYGTYINNTVTIQNGNNELVAGP